VAALGEMSADARTCCLVGEDMGPLSV
jgi:hypothetical protein